MGLPSRRIGTVSVMSTSAQKGGAEGADGVIHLAFFHGVSHPSFGTRLRILLGGSPRGIVPRFGRIAADADGRAIETLGSVLAGSGRPLVVAFPTMALRPSHLATEDDAPDPNSPGSARIPSLRTSQREGPGAG
jgi:hypothetical protein